VLRLASEHGVPVIARGAGTNLSAGAVPQLGGIVLSLTRMNALLEVDAKELAAVAHRVS
jgi:glycolate oxidase